MTRKRLTKKLKEYSDYMVKIRRIQQDNTKQIAELKEHDIFKIWTSIRKGGKTTLEAMLNLNNGINKLEESYIHSMDRIIISLENILRRIRKLEENKIDKE
ncbi:MAG: hypothetical protein [Asgard archaea virus VerdaV3]|nr:MAG: hypothetical protein [Asgard archaea virus VerdaV3]